MTAFLFTLFSLFFVCMDLNPATALNSVSTLALEVIRNFTPIQVAPVFKGKPTYFYKNNNNNKKQAKVKANAR